MYCVVLLSSWEVGAGNYKTQLLGCQVIQRVIPRGIPKMNVTSPDNDDYISETQKRIVILLNYEI